MDGGSLVKYENAYVQRVSKLSGIGRLSVFILLAQGVVKTIEILKVESEITISPGSSLNSPGSSGILHGGCPECPKSGKMMSGIFVKLKIIMLNDSPKARNWLSRIVRNLIVGVSRNVQIDCAKWLIGPIGHVMKSNRYPECTGS
ncbi:MAG: hypothetical protein WC721_02345 [Victivallaceae bacterium]|jgi:hypothetical protein